MVSPPDVVVAGAVEKTQTQAQARKAVPFGGRADGNGKLGLSTWHNLPEAQDRVVALQVEEETLPPTPTAVRSGRHIVTAKQTNAVNTEEDAVLVSRQALATAAPAQTPGLIDEGGDEVVKVPPPHAPVRAEAARPTNKMPEQAKSSRQGTGPMKQTTLSFSKPKR